ncbi:hypothetical protein LSH36_177g04099 [Paralvinella palmiformis]|uniref:Uncharacterized protein n=1 Tax=Paralvinella palmiformis TaxID=53620 RepID=A0AAD9N7B1_9ANNE|nr:hypothetical protein LSH36_177g04099 [Paralvinella palmiformis]
MADLLDFSSSRLGNVDLIQQIALSVWLNKGDDYKKMLQNVTQARIVYELYNRISPEKQIELYQQECIMAIVSFIQKNPRASEGKLVTEISKHVEIFKQKVATL